MEVEQPEHPYITDTVHDTTVLNAAPEEPPEEFRPVDLGPIGAVKQHMRNNESFSRSRSSTGALLEPHIVNPTEDTWQPEAQPEASPEVSKQQIVADFNTAFEAGATLGHFHVDSAEHGRQQALEELEGWADENQNNYAPRAAGQQVASPEIPEAHDATESVTRRSEEETEAALAESRLLADSTTGVHEAAEFPATTAIASNTGDPFDETAGSDEWLGQTAETTAPQPTAMTSDVDSVQAQDGQELREPLLSQQTPNVTIEAPVEQAGFEQALKEVSEDLKASQDSAADVGSVKQPVEDDFFSNPTDAKQDLTDSWAQVLADSKNEDSSWEAAFADDDEGFLDDTGFLEDEPSKAAPPKTVAYMPSAPQRSYTPLPSYPSTPAQQPDASPFTPAPPVQNKPAGPDRQQSHITKFFEDLPVTQRVKKSKQQVVHPPGTQPTPPMPPSQVVPPQRTPSIPSPPQPPPGQPQPPQKLDLFPPQPTLSPDAPPDRNQLPQPPSQNSRYSPAPTMSASPASRYAAAPPSSSPQAASRYSPTPLQPTPPNRVNTSPPINPPLSGPPPSVASHRFAPRTSSPLAQPDGRPLLDRSTTAPNPPPATTNSIKLPSEPVHSTAPPPPPKLEPPKRPRTQSPERQASRYAPRAVSEDRRASLQEHASITAAPTISSHPPARQPAAVAQPQAPFRTRGPSASENVEFIQPSDSDQLSDPLQRWRGAPTLHRSSGSLMVTHFPKRDLRFGGGRSAPACKCSPGDLKISKISERMPAEESVASFPGPLKSKSKKKELLAWLTSRVDALQNESLSTEMSMDPRISERLLLWKLMRTFIEHDGMLSGNANVDNAVRQILIPPQSEPTSAHHSRTVSSAPNLGRPDAANSLSAAEIRRLLLSGEREKAVWHAVDNRLWGHAMLIASSAEPSLWKQVALEFVRNEVRGTSSDQKSHAALYSIMAQNWDESVDELVPASARAGFQMVSTADNGDSSTNAVEGLNKWQETLSLVVANRSPQDEYGLLALGKLLHGYGRTEAAHVCFLFAPSLVHIGGLDDAEAHFTLLGADVANNGGQDVDSILLTEIYEYGLSLRPNAGTAYIPYLQAYKLHHAQVLADAGCRSEASQYCDAIGTAIKSMTRPSAYYHPLLINRLEDLNQRLSQTPKDNSSWISKPTVGKVSGSMWAKFNQFVAGDEDTASHGSGPQSDNEAGPFAKVPGGTPTISRNASQADLSTFTPIGAPPLSTAGANSRYAPNYAAPKPVEPTITTTNNYAPTHTYIPGDPPSAPRDIPKPGQSFASPSRSDSFGAGIPGPNFNPFQPHQNLLGISDTASIASSYDPPILQHPGLSDQFGSPSTTFSDRATSSHGIPHEDMPVIEEESAAPQENGGMSDHASGFEATGGYAPPTSGYAPPEGNTGYVPYEPAPDSPPADAAPRKKKSFMDLDDDDLASRAASLKSNSSEPVTSRAPSDAVRKAAEADAERDRLAKEARKTSGWFGGWFAGKKDPNAPTVHKAKLGEENSFYYDPDLKRWVNKKAPASNAGSSAGTPPPPKAMSRPAAAPTSAPVQGMMPPPGLGPPSRSATPARSDEGSDGLAPPLGSMGPPSNPPSRPATGMSGASNGGLDDLLHPGGRRAAGAKKGKKRQVVDVMGAKS